MATTNCLKKGRDYELVMRAGADDQPVTARLGTMPAFEVEPEVLQWGARSFTLLRDAEGKPKTREGRLVYQEAVAWTVDREVEGKPPPPVKRVETDGGLGPLFRQRGIPVEVARSPEGERGGGES